MSGKVDSTSSKYNTSTSALIISGICDNLSNYNEQNDELVSTMKAFWETESIGISNTEDEISEPKNFIRDIQFRDNRYEVSLPWKQERLPLSTNYLQSFNRLKSLENRLKKEPELLAQYNQYL